MSIKVKYESLKDSIEKSSIEFGLSKRLIFAVIMTESGGNTNVMRFENGYKWLFRVKDMAKKAGFGCTDKTMEVMQSCSFGLMQVMGANYYINGGQGWCSEMLIPEKGIYYGCKILKSITKKHKNHADTYAVYNAGSLIKREGNYKNQENVNNFLNWYNQIDFLD